MTKLVVRNPFPVLDRDSFLTPFDRMFDDIVSSAFPQINETIGVNPFGNSAYPKVNVYEFDDKIAIIAEIPGLDKKDLEVEVEDGEDINASFEDGVLSIEIPKIEPDLPKKHTVKIA